MRPDDKVTCINASGAPFLRVGRHYTVDAVYGKFIAIREYPVCDRHPGWYKHRFRRLPQTDIGVFLDLLKPIPAGTPALTET